MPRHVIFLAVAVTLASGLFSFYVADHPRVDARAYDRIAWNLAQGFGYVEDVSMAETPAKDDAIIRVGPGYQFFLAGVYVMAGHQYWVVWLLHALLRGASVVLIYMIARQLFTSTRGAFLAALFFGFSPDLIAVNAFLLTETLFLFLLVFAIHMSLRYMAEPSHRGVLFAGSLWAFAILVRPVALLAFLIALGSLIWRRAWKDAVILCIAPIIIVGLWSAYVTHRYNSFILTTTAGGYDLWVGNNLDATGGFEKTPEIQSLRDTTHSVELEKISHKKYFEFLFDHPLRFIELQFRKLSIYGNVVRPGGAWIGLYDHKLLLYFILAMSVAGNILLFGVGIAGLLLLAEKSKNALTRVFVAMAIAAPLGVIPIIVETRYRYPFFPFLAVGAAFFLTQKPINSKLLAKVLVVLGIFAMYDLWSNWAHLMQRLQGLF